MHCRSGSKKDPLLVLPHSITKRASIHFWSTGLEPSTTGRLPCGQGGVGRVPYRVRSVRPTDMPDVQGALRTSGQPCRWFSVRVQRAASTGTALTGKRNDLGFVRRV